MLYLGGCRLFLSLARAFYLRSSGPIWRIAELAHSVARVVGCAPRMDERTGGFQCTSLNDAKGCTLRQSSWKTLFVVPSDLSQRNRASSTSSARRPWKTAFSCRAAVLELVFMPTVELQPQRAQMMQDLLRDVLPERDHIGTSFPTTLLILQNRTRHVMSSSANTTPFPVVLLYSALSDVHDQGR